MNWLLLVICPDVRGNVTIKAVKQKLKEALAQREKSRIADDSRMPSAVLVLIYEKEGEYFILLTKRTETVEYHKGQVSFPGGAYEETDGTLVNTALRECAEEIGVAAEVVEVLGELDDVFTVTSGFNISPFVAVIPWPYQFKPDPDETKEILEIPISALLDKNCLRPTTQNVLGREITTDAYCYRDCVIWGATAQILRQFLDVFAWAVADTTE